MRVPICRVEVEALMDAYGAAEKAVAAASKLCGPREAKFEGELCLVV